MRSSRRPPSVFRLQIMQGVKARWTDPGGTSMTAERRPAMDVARRIEELRRTIREHDYRYYVLDRLAEAGERELTAKVGPAVAAQLAAFIRDRANHRMLEVIRGER